MFVLILPASAQQVFNCSTWTQDGVCGAQQYGYNYSFNENGNGPTVVNGKIQMLPFPAGHAASGLIYYGTPTNPIVPVPVSAQAFTANFVFIPDGLNLAFTLNNSNNVPGGLGGPKFVAGAGCEAGFYQAYTPPEPNNVFALELDQNSPLTATAQFTYSSAMIYSSNQSPCQPAVNSDFAPTKVSTFPVPLNSPATMANTTTGDTYSAMVSYDGSNLTLNLFDITAGGSCPGSSCFTHTWPNVNIPAIVGGTTAYVGLTAGSNSNTVAPLTVSSFSFSNGSTQPPPPPPPPSTVAAPTFSSATFTSPSSSASASSSPSCIQNCTGITYAWTYTNPPAGWADCGPQLQTGCFKGFQLTVSLNGTAAWTFGTSKLTQGTLTYNFIPGKELKNGTYSATLTASAISSTGTVLQSAPATIVSHYHGKQI
jgi:hypothetical protein